MMDFKSNKIILLLAIFLVSILLLIIILFVLSSTNKSNNFAVIPKFSNPTVIPTRINLPGKINLLVDKTKSNKSTLVLIASADSKNQQMTSFDVDLRYNNKKLKKESVEGMIAGFDMVPTDIPIKDTDLSELIVTGIKSPYNNDEIVFNTTQLIRITFKVLAPISSNDIQLFFIINETNDSNLVNIDNQDILGSVVNPSIN